MEKRHNMRALYEKVKLLIDRSKIIIINNGCIRSKEGELLFENKASRNNG